MRVVHVDSGREMRGGQWQVLYLAEDLAQAGHSITLLAPAESPLLAKAIEKHIEARPLTVRALASCSRDADLTHVHDARSHSLAAMWARSPLVVSRRVGFPVKRGLLSRWKYRRAARYIAVSRYVEGALRKAGVPEDRISVVYDGVRVPAMVTPLSGRAKARVVAIASDDPRKGAGLLEKAADAAGILLHFSNNLWEDLLTAEVFVYISRLEGLGSAALLAMAAGTPVVASRVGGLPEIVEHEVSGLLTENDPESIASAVCRLLTDPALAEALSANARRKVAERFSVDAMVQGTLETYGKVV